MPYIDDDDGIRTLLAHARTIAVVGLSDAPGRDSNRVGRYLLGAGYDVIPVNPAVGEALGLVAAPDLDSLAGRRVDIVDVFRRPEHLPAIVEAALRIGAGALWLQYGTRDERSVRRALDAGLTVAGERCIMVEHARLLGRR